ncbi:trypsin-like serine protease [Bdellovibrio bacteriovorus]|uniref:S1 family peptidase n=1 Tax=Bdellovibrio bacteriovorus TaxID=959 RepID=UPI0021D288B0|nr:trypsin-like serine protease [Bdellovibrio bacteriovorus]UXR64247.1 trypsin-like serine protease [Bdellovibrio bacteriovorus]
MRKLLIFGLLLLTACQESLQNGEVSPLLDDAIVGGREVDNADPVTRQALNFRVFHSPVTKEDAESITTYYKVSQCTGSAISTRLILTAAHCIIQREDASHRVDIKNGEGQSITYKAAKVAVHPKYLEGDKNYDVALAYLEADLPADVEILHLPQKEALMGLTSVVAAGFGRTDGRPSQPGNSGILRTVELRVSKYAPTLPYFMVNQSEGKGFCQGDSGGPAMAMINGVNTVVGVASKTTHKMELAPGEEKNLCILEGQYMNVQFHLDWILTESARFIMQ